MRRRQNYGRAVVSAFNSVALRNGIPQSDVATFSAQSTNLAPDVRAFSKYDERVLQAELGNVMETYDAVLMPVGGELALSVANLLSHYELPPRKVKRLGTGLLDDPGLVNEESLEGAWFAAPSPRLSKNFQTSFYQSLQLPAAAAQLAGL